jgi:hypothetical protein
MIPGPPGQCWPKHEPLAVQSTREPSWACRPSCIPLGLEPFDCHGAQAFGITLEPIRVPANQVAQAGLVNRLRDRQLCVVAFRRRRDDTPVQHVDRLLDAVLDVGAFNPAPEHIEVLEDVESVVGENEHGI